jgi:hypothetical protein
MFLLAVLLALLALALFARPVRSAHAHPVSDGLLLTARVEVDH